MSAQPRPVHRIDRREGTTLVALCGDRRPAPTLADHPVKGAVTTCPDCRRQEAVRDGLAAMEGLAQSVSFAVSNPATPSEVALDLRVALDVAESVWAKTVEALA